MAPATSVTGTDLKIGLNLTGLRRTSGWWAVRARAGNGAVN